MRYRRAVPTSARSSGAWLLALAAIGVMAIALSPPIPDPPAFRAFVDRRSFFGIPNFWDVLSNAPLFIVGLWGSYQIVRLPPQRFVDSAEKWPYLVAFIAIALSGIGSTYYHLAPLDERLVWDRLPIALSFMALVSALAGDRVGGRAALSALVPLLVLGAGSVFYWRWSALHGAENIVPYAVVQYGALLAIVVIAIRVPSRYTRTRDVFIAVGLYVLAKIAEVLDGPIYSLGHLLSGHTLKHLVAALAAAWVLRMLELRQPTNSGSGP
jgi:hypothetical protein